MQEHHIKIHVFKVPCMYHGNICLVFGTCGGMIGMYQRVSRGSLVPSMRDILISRLLVKE